MASMTVIRRVPPPIIGMMGVLHDREFDAFEERLDWLEAAGCLPIVRVDPTDQQAMASLAPSLKRSFAEAGEDGLPLILVDEVVVSRGVYPTRTQLAHWIGSHRTLTDVCAPQ